MKNSSCCRKSFSDHFDIYMSYIKYLYLIIFSTSHHSIKIGKKKDPGASQANRPSQRRGGPASRPTDRPSRLSPPGARAAQRPSSRAPPSPETLPHRSPARLLSLPLSLTPGPTTFFLPKPTPPRRPAGIPRSPGSPPDLLAPTCPSSKSRFPL